MNVAYPAGAFSVLNTRTLNGSGQPMEAMVVYDIQNRSHTGGSTYCMKPYSPIAGASSMPVRAPAPDHAGVAPHLSEQPEPVQQRRSPFQRAGRRLGHAAVHQRQDHSVKQAGAGQDERRSAGSSRRPPARRRATSGATTTSPSSGPEIISPEGS